MAAPSEPCQVECYSGHRYAQEPRVFTWRGIRREVTAIHRTWHSPEGLVFVVATADGQQFKLSYNDLGDLWQVSEVEPPDRSS